MLNLTMNRKLRIESDEFTNQFQVLFCVPAKCVIISSQYYVAQFYKVDIQYIHNQYSTTMCVEYSSFNAVQRKQRFKCYIQVKQQHVKQVWSNLIKVGKYERGWKTNGGASGLPINRDGSPTENPSKYSQLTLPPVFILYY